MKLKLILALVLAVVLLAGCSSAPKKEESPAVASEESKEESSKEESSKKEEASKVEEEEEEDVSESESEAAEEDEEEEEEEEEEEPAPESKPEESSAAEEEEEDGINSVYKRVCEDAPEDTLMILMNGPDDAFLYATRISDEFDLMVDDQVMMIPRYEHSTIRLWSLKMEFSEDGETAMQVHDELLYEVEDSTVETVLFTSVPRIEDTARYAVEVITPYGEGEYFFNFYGEDLPQIEYIVAAKG